MFDWDQNSTISTIILLRVGIADGEPVLTASLQNKMRHFLLLSMSHTYSYFLRPDYSP
jgi:hypothetical protein